MTSTPQDLGFSLEGVRVVELADRRGEFCGKLLAHMGADVIKVEPPEGAESRRLGPFYNDERELEKSIFWWHYNQNKRSVTLDLESAEGRAAFDKLLGSADMLLETVKPGGLALAGTSWEEVSRAHPGLIVPHHLRLRPRRPLFRLQGERPRRPCRGRADDGLRLPPA